MQSEAANNAAVTGARGAGGGAPVEPLVRGAHLAGTFVFEFQGALAAIAGQLDLFGDLVLAFATALGGGVIRDVLLRQVPVMLRVDVYATAAMFGAIVLVTASRLGVSRTLAACFVLRMLAIWQLPGSAATG